jgi:hypothetical protein
VAARTISDAVLADALLAARGTPEGLYGRKMADGCVVRATTSRSAPQIASCGIWA